MRFYGKPNAIVWNGRENKPLCKFNEKGEVELEDPDKIRQMKGLGYMGDFDEPSAFKPDIREGGAMATVSVPAPNIKIKVIEEPSEVETYIVDFDNMTGAEMKAYCKSHGITGVSKLKAAELREHLKAL
jgi:hypothetical protein